MNEIQFFTNPEFGEIRTVDRNGETWFVGRDIATALGYKNTKDALSIHVDDEDKSILQRSDLATIENHIPKSALPVNFVRGDIPNRGLTIINESGVYALIFSSKLPDAKKFKHWVTSEVLPAIRKHGAYAPTQTDRTSLDIQLLNARTMNANVYLSLIDRIDTKSETYKPILMAYAANTAAGQNILPLPKSDHGKTYSASEVATMLGVTANKIGRVANANGMKIPEFGQWFHDIASNGKEIDSFRYNEKAVWKFKQLLGV